MEVAYDGELPDDIPDDWAEELLAPLERGERRDLRDAYGDLEKGDVLSVVYLPERGTRVRLNGGTIVDDAGPRFVDAVADLFLGPEPVSDSLRGELTAGLR